VTPRSSSRVTRSNPILLADVSFFFFFLFFKFKFIRVKSIHTGTQGGEANSLTRRPASKRADHAPRQPPGSGVHSKVPTAPGSGGHLEVSTAPGSRGLLEVPTSPGSGKIYKKLKSSINSSSTHFYARACLLLSG
jgi:hypothetical protein